MLNAWKRQYIFIVLFFLSKYGLLKNCLVSTEFNLSLCVLVNISTQRRIKG